MTLQKNHIGPEASRCLAILRRVIPIWPKPDGSEPDDFKMQVAQFLTEDFCQAHFLNKIKEIIEITSVAETSDRVEVSFNDDDWFQKAVFLRNQGDEWLLKSLEFLCPICFGTGENDGERCTMCGGSGWGAS